MFKRVNEEITIPQELSNQYLSVKKQISNKQTRKDQILKAVNQINNEINILNKNLLAIEQKAAAMQGQQKNQPEPQAQNTQQTQTAEANVNVAESINLDARWHKYINEGIVEDEEEGMFADEVELFADEEDTEITSPFTSDGNIMDDEDLEDDEYEESESLNIKEAFTLKIIQSGGEEIIAKFYKNKEEGFWKARVVQGDEEPIESMQFDPEMDKVNLIEKINEIPGFDEIEEIHTEDYEDLIDDKEKIDKEYYGDIIEEE